jgi:hypothetical protein
MRIKGNDMKNKTAAWILMDVVWRHGKKDTWQRINYAMRDALSLAVAGGLEFQASDFTEIYNQFRAAYWVGKNSEWIYSSAIVNGNQTCIAAYEEWMGRIPFFANRVSSGYCQDSYLHRDSIDHDRERLAVGMKFVHDGYEWEVTSFDDNSKSPKDGTVRAVRRTTPKRLKAFTHKEITTLFPAPKKPAKVKEDVL